MIDINELNEDVRTKIENGEQPLYCCPVQKFELYDKPHKALFKKKAIISCIVCMILCMAYLFLAKKAGKTVPLVYAIIIGSCLYSAFSEIITSRKLKKSEYVITDRRAILSESTKSIYFKDIDKYDFRKDDVGMNALLVGEKALAMDNVKWREQALLPLEKDDKTGKIIKGVFYGFDDTFQTVFEDTLKNFK